MLARLRNDGAHPRAEMAQRDFLVAQGADGETVRRHAGLHAGDQAIVAENLWRAQRYGFDAGLIDLGSHRLVSAREMLENTLEALDDDIHALACAPQVERAWHILENGTSAHAQLERYRERRQAGDSHAEALSHVVQWLADASVAA